MLSVLYSAAGGLDVAAKSQDVLARNIANAGHQGYKRATLRFADELRQAGGSTALTAVEGVGFEQGQLLRTDSPLDLALEGDGFFTLQDADGGFLYTRKGSFTTGTDGRIVTSSGFTVLGTSGPILLPPGAAITVQKDGSIMSNGELIGKLRLAAFPDTSSLSRAGTSLFVETGDASRAMPALDCSVRQGFLENSNVNILTEMVRMIENARAFEANQRAASAANSAMTQLNQTAAES